MKSGGRPHAVVLREESLMAEGKGEWYHAWYHLVCIIAGAGTMAFPGTYAYLGWTAGIICWIIGITFALYTAYLIVIVVEQVSAREGYRIVRSRDVTALVWGPIAGLIAIVPWQYLNILGISIALVIGVAQGLQDVQTTLQPDASYESAASSPVPLYGYIIMSCFIWWLAALIPSFRKLRFLSFLALAMFVAFSSIAIALCFNHGSINDAANNQDEQTAQVFTNPPWEVAGLSSLAYKAFRVMNSLGTIALAYGNRILPEVVGTVRHDTGPKQFAKHKMFKAFNFEFALVAPYYLLVGIAGYWAFGFTAVEGNFVLAQLLPPIPGYQGDGPAWTLVLANLTVFVQAIPSCQVYNQVLYDVFDPMLCKQELGVWSAWNTGMRMLVRTAYICFIGLIACLLPSFGSFVSLIGSLSVIPCVFIVPCLLHLAVSKPGPRDWMLYADSIIAFIAFAIGSMGTVSSIYTIKNQATIFSVSSATVG